MIRLFSIIFFFIAVVSFGQQKENVAFTINNKPVYVSELLDNYHKNIEVTKANKETLNDYLQLFIDYKLKIFEAKNQKLDTFATFKKEYNNYKKEIINSFVKNDSTLEYLAQEAYERLHTERDVSHILIFLNENANPADTLIAYNKLLKAKELLKSGVSFNEVAKKYSQDPTVNKNFGNIGFFTALQMVYPFENVAYKTKVGTISNPFRTKFGMHILKVNAVRKNRGAVEVAHIMIKNSTKNAKKKIDSIYQLLIQKHLNFFELAKKCSEDRATSLYGGKLPRFGTGKMILPFEKQAFSLAKIGEISKPFQTTYGWHIVRLLNKFPLQTYKEMKPILIQKIKRVNRYKNALNKKVNILAKNYKIIIDSVALKQFYTDNFNVHANKFTQNLLTIEDKKYSQKDFGNFQYYMKRTTIAQNFAEFKQQKILDYYYNQKLLKNASLRAELQNFKDGLLLFDLLEKEVWKKSKDNGLLKDFYLKNKEFQFKNLDLNNQKGKIIAVFQNHLTQELTNKLHSKYQVKINKKEIKKLLKSEL